jgi:hypothetical protein
MTNRRTDIMKILDSGLRPAGMTACRTDILKTLDSGLRIAGMTDRYEQTLFK